LLDHRIGLLEPAVDRALFLLELGGTALGVLARALDLALLRLELVVALLHFGAPAFELVVELGLALARGFLAFDLGGALDRVDLGLRGGAQLVGLGLCDLVRARIAAPAPQARAEQHAGPEPERDRDEWIDRFHQYVA